MYRPPSFWPITLVAATLAVALAAVGLILDVFTALLDPRIYVAFLVASLGATTVAFTRLALRVRQLELENEGLVEEISQEFDSVKTRLEIFADGLEVEDDGPIRRVVVK